MNDQRRPARPREPFQFDRPQPGERQAPAVDHAKLAETLAGTDAPGQVDSAEHADQAEREQPLITTAPIGSTIAERTATSLENYSASILENIRELRQRLDGLEMFFVEDAAQCKERIQSHMTNGQRVTQIVQGISAEIDELEKRRDEMLAGHAKGTR